MTDLPAAAPGSNIREYAEQLLKHVDHYDRDGREIGVNYDIIRNAILAAFPTVTTNGIHKGRPTIMLFKELAQFVTNAHQRGERMPHRPRRKKKYQPRKIKGTMHLIERPDAVRSRARVKMDKNMREAARRQRNVAAGRLASGKPRRDLRPPWTAETKRLYAKRWAARRRARNIKRGLRCDGIAFKRAPVTPAILEARRQHDLVMSAARARRRRARLLAAGLTTQGTPWKPRPGLQPGPAVANGALPAPITRSPTTFM